MQTHSSHTKQTSSGSVPTRHLAVLTKLLNGSMQNRCYLKQKKEVISSPELLGDWTTRLRKSRKIKADLEGSAAENTSPYTTSTKEFISSMSNLLHMKNSR